ncbi:MAG: hypothetical protein E6J90_15685 [Deltaproteobacteria bacterium]|nr:MAG: hypothetical protein E6J90_15685 [Deltaproteobacteria bacterium]
MQDVHDLGQVLAGIFEDGQLPELQLVFKLRRNFEEESTTLTYQQCEKPFGRAIAIFPALDIGSLRCIVARVRSVEGIRSH